VWRIIVIFFNGLIGREICINRKGENIFSFNESFFFISRISEIDRIFIYKWFIYHSNNKYGIQNKRTVPYKVLGTGELFNLMNRDIG